MTITDVITDDYIISLDLFSPSKPSPCEANSFLLETSWANVALSPAASALSSESILAAAVSAAWAAVAAP